jgi:hypothetical protein
MRIKISNNYFSILFLTAIVTLSGCLKSSDKSSFGSITGNTTGKQFISIPKAASSPNILGVEAKNGFQPLSLFSFSYDNASPASSEITVTVAVNNSLVTDPTLVLLPTAAYNVPSLATKIEVGKFISAPLLVNLNTDLLDPTKKYAVGFTITTVTGGISVSSNLNNVVYAFTIKNKYDGIYSFRGRLDHPADRSADWLRTPFSYDPYQIHLITTGPRTVKFLNTAYNSGFHPLATPGISGFGSTEPSLEFDANDNLISVTNTFPNPSNGRGFKINTNVTGSKYVPASKKVYAAFFMTQPGFIDMPIYDTLTFVKVRP